MRWIIGQIFHQSNTSIPQSSCLSNCTRVNPYLISVSNSPLGSISQGGVYICVCVRVTGESTRTATWAVNPSLDITVEQQWRWGPSVSPHVHTKQPSPVVVAHCFAKAEPIWPHGVRSGSKMDMWDVQVTETQKDICWEARETIPAFKEDPEEKGDLVTSSLHSVTSRGRNLGLGRAEQRLGSTGFLMVMLSLRINQVRAYFTPGHRSYRSWELFFQTDWVGFSVTSSLKKYILSSVNIYCLLSSWCLGITQCTWKLSPL